MPCGLDPGWLAREGTCVIQALLQDGHGEKNMPNPAGSSHDLARYHVYLSGRVQGVGMRATVADLAPDHGIKGWVRNLSDGRVEIVAEGTKAELDRFLAALERQMGRYIERLEKNSEPADGAFRGFTITY